MTGLDGWHIIEPAKLVDYLLSPNHPTGRHKAAFFTNLGFAIDDPATFGAALERHARTRPIVRVVQSEFGTKREIRCNLDTPDGTNPCIVTIWIQPVGTAMHRLVTAYPARPSQ